MLTQIEKDIFLAPIDILAHQTNCFHTMGSGIAREIKTRFPEAYEADKRTLYGEIKKLGTYDLVKVTSKNPNPQLKYICNVYSQFDYGRDKCYTKYDAIVNGFTLLRDLLIAKKKDNFVIGVPWKYGSNVAGGDWEIVSAIFRSIFKDSSIHVIICKHTDATYLNQRILATPSKPA